MCDSFYVTGEAQSVYPGQHEERSLYRCERNKSISFRFKDVRLLDSPFKQNMGVNRMDVVETVRLYIAVPDGRVCREKGILFHKEIGRMSRSTVNYGDITGHILSALSYLYASTGDEA